MKIEEARVALSHYRDKLGLSNREMGRAFQDKVDPQSFVDFMNGDDTALNGAQQCYIGNEAVDYVYAEDLEREEAKRMGITPPPGVRQILGISN